MNNNNLQLGWSHYMGLKYHMEEALLEKNKQTITATCSPPTAIFSKKYHNDIKSIEHYHLL